MIFFIFLAVGFGGITYPFINIPKNPQCISPDREVLLSCFEHFDSDHNNELSASEIQNILNIANVSYPGMTGQALLELCDIDYNGILNSNDWNKIRSCCRDEIKITYTCNVCIHAGWTFPTRKK